MATTKLAAAVAGIMLLAIPSLATAQQQTGKRPEDHVRAVVLAVAAAIERGDLKALDGLYSHDPSVLIIEGASADVGWKQYRNHHLTPELKSVKNLEYKYSKVTVSIVGEVAWASFDYSLDAVMKGQPLSIRGKGTLVLRNTGGQWKIVHSHTSGRPAGTTRKQ